MKKLPLLLVALLGLGAVAMTVRPPEVRLTRAGYPVTPSASFLKVLARSHLQLVADLFWLKLINVSGSAKTSLESREMYVYGNLITDIDPQFKIVYWFAGLNLPYFEDRQWQNADLASELYEKGYKLFPEDLKISMYYAQNEALYRHNRAKGAELLKHVATLPGAPVYAAPLAMRLMAEQSDFDSALAFATELYRTARTPADRELFERRIKEIVLEQRLQTVDDAVARYKARIGAAPQSLNDLVGAGDLPQIPEDPLGGRIVLGHDGRAHSTVMEKRFETFVDPKDPSSQWRPQQ